MVVNKNPNWIEDRVISAEKQYERMMTNLENGIINQTEIWQAMDLLIIAHKIALNHNKGYLIK